MPRFFGPNFFGPRTDRGAAAGREHSTAIPFLWRVAWGVICGGGVPSSHPGEYRPRLLFTAQALAGGSSMRSEKQSLFQTDPPHVKK